MGAYQKKTHYIWPNRVKTMQLRIIMIRDKLKCPGHGKCAGMKLPDEMNVTMVTLNL